MAFVENLFIEPTNRCNLKCVMCGFDPRYPRGDMDFDLFEQIVDELESTGMLRHRYVRLWQMGEPLVYPNIVKMVQHLTARGFFGCLSTNGLLLTRDMSERLLDAGISWLQVSLDKIAEEEYRNWRGHSHHKRIIENINTFLELRDRKGLKATMTLLFIVPWHPIEQGGTTAMPSRDLADILKFIESQIQAPVALEIRPLLRWPLAPRNAADTVPPPFRDKLPTVCTITADTLTVKWNGDVMPCCMDLNGLTVIGNVKRQSLQSILETRVPEFRQRMEEGATSLASCRDCQFYVGWKVHEDKLRETFSALDWPGREAGAAGMQSIVRRIEAGDRQVGAGRLESVAGLFDESQGEFTRLLAAFEPPPGMPDADRDRLADARTEVLHLRNYMYKFKDVGHTFHGSASAPPRGSVLGDILRIGGRYSLANGVERLAAQVDGMDATLRECRVQPEGEDAVFEASLSLEGLERRLHLISIDALQANGSLRKRVLDLLVHPRAVGSGWVVGSTLKPSYIVMQEPAERLVSPERQPPDLSECWTDLPAPAGFLPGVSYPFVRRTYRLPMPAAGEMTGLQVQVGTYGRVIPATLRLRLNAPGVPGGDRDALWAPRALEDHGWATFRFAPLRVKKGQLLTLSIELLATGNAQAISLFQHEPAPASLIRRIEKRLSDRRSVPLARVLLAKAAEKS